MGSRSTSSPTTKHTVTTKNSSIQDNEGLAIANSDSNTINVLDGGAIENAFNFAATANEQTGQVLSNILGFSKATIKDSVESVREAYDDGKETASEDIIKVGAVVIGGAIIALMVIKK